MKESLPPLVPGKLAAILNGIPKAALAFSGGADSSYLLYAAMNCHVDVCAYYVNSQFQPQFELDDARRLAGELQARLKEISLDILSNPIVAANPADRCYHCKRVLLGAIIKQANDDGYSTLMDGSNASDDAEDRPGMRALQEFGVRSLLREAGLSKEDVRIYSRGAGLFTWDKPAYACLATRIPAGEPITPEIVYKIEKAETILFQMGFSDFRARILSKAVKLQFPASQLPQAARRHMELTKALSPLFSDVLLDLTPR